MKKRPGFTMTELLTVIAILIVLATLLIPNLVRMRRAAKQRVCAANLRSLAAGVIMYTGDNSGIFPPHAMEQGGDPGSWWGHDRTRREDDETPKGEIYQYVRDAAAYRCPTLNTAEAPKSGITLKWSLSSKSIGYGYNAYFLGRYDGRPADQLAAPPATEGGIPTEWRYNIAAVRDSELTIMLADATIDSGPHGDSGVIWWPAALTTNHQGPYPRHLDQSNVATVDQGVRSYRNEELYDATGAAHSYFWDPRHPR